jgi:hypothetical protein
VRSRLPEKEKHKFKITKFEEYEINMCCGNEMEMEK